MMVQCQIRKIEPKDLLRIRYNWPKVETIQFQLISLMTMLANDAKEWRLRFPLNDLHYCLLYNHFNQ